MDVAECDDGGTGGMIRGEWEVTPIGDLLLPPDAEAEKWKPIDWWSWAEHIRAGAGQ